MGNTVTNVFSEDALPSRQVATKYGSIVGKRLISEGDKQVDAFLGIPFAKPPVGELRFAKPEPPEPWNDVKKTVKFGPRGIQKDWMFYVKWKFGETSEDNLYLNVFTPVWEPPSDGFAVMVFVHGGAFVSDSSVKYGDIGICRHLVPHGVVVVTVQYRLGYLGFSSTGDSACVDNLALWDMTAALEWVNQNIAAFAGNPNNVTVFGQSAGGASVDLLSLSPVSRDLFHKVIPMSGNASCEWAINEDVIRTCIQFAAKTGVEETNTVEFIKKLRQVDAMKFATSLRALKNETRTIKTEIGPRVDGNFLPKHPREMRLEAPIKPTLVGTCQYEGLLFLLLDNKKPSMAQLEEIIAEQIPEKYYADFIALRSEALRLYVDPEKDHHDKAKLQKAFVMLYSDLFMNSGTQEYVLEQLKQNNANTYLYSFDYCNPKNWGIMGFMVPFEGATHCTDLTYLLDIRFLMNFSFDEQDNKMIANMTKLWTNFAKYGNPNGTSDATSEKLPFEWLAVDDEHPQRCLSLKPEPQMCDNFHDGRPLFWANLKNRLHK